MSHELRTPLNAVIGFSQLMEREHFGPIGSPKYREYAGDILTSGRHLLSLINDVLDISKIEAGRLEIEVTSIDTRQAIEDAVRLVNGRAHEGRVRLVVDVETDCRATFADERALKQILLNVLSNAIKFTPSDGSVTISARSAGVFVEYTIRDTGKGISPEAVGRLFKPFEQADNRYGHAEGGTGLGLALVRALVDLHKGECALESELGVGTTVRVRLPADTSAHKMQSVA